MYIDATFENKIDLSFYLFLDLHFTNKCESSTFCDVVIFLLLVCYSSA